MVALLQNTRTGDTAACTAGAHVHTGPKGLYKVSDEGPDQLVSEAATITSNQHSPAPGAGHTTSEPCIHGQHNNLHACGTHGCMHAHSPLRADPLPQRAAR